MNDALQPPEGSLETDPLNILICRDNIRQMFAALTPTERLIAILRGLYWTDREIAELLTVETTTIARALQRARRRLVAKEPREIANLVKNRQWLSRSRRSPDADLTAHEVAQILHTTPQSITRFCRQGRFPNARLEPDPLPTWYIPSADLDAFYIASGL